ncbi:hypothetical protein FRB94_010166 [Tulasnella sp. JGI-2019a]|nr:hypothetical protein FRB94_010166 [Tulasnella sp. JGI-2019a]KAG9035576.1 hypothetical protein FRB95_011120 [Tulasnella sp. JGI-2019a]
MIYPPLATAFLAVGSAFRSPHVEILNYAPILEYLEDNFYSGALAKFGAAGLPSWVRARFEQIAAHEATHVAFLAGALGSSTTAACQYIPIHRPQVLRRSLHVLEGVGVSAYLGDAASITNKDYLTAAGSILTTEARHASWVSFTVNEGSPWPGALDVPLDFNQVYSLASTFITSYPSTNLALLVKAFPALTFSPMTAMSGDEITVSYKGTADNVFMDFYTGLSQMSAHISNGKVIIPNDLEGTVYAVVSTNSTAATDNTTKAGPAVFVFPVSF